MSIVPLDILSLPTGLCTCKLSVGGQASSEKLRSIPAMALIYKVCVLTKCECGLSSKYKDSIAAVLCLASTPSLPIPKYIGRKNFPHCLSILLLTFSLYPSSSSLRHERAFDDTERTSNCKTKQCNTSTRNELSQW